MANSNAAQCITFSAAEREGPFFSPREEALWLLQQFFGADAGAMQKRLIALANGGTEACMTTEYSGGLSPHASILIQTREEHK